MFYAPKVSFIGALEATFQVMLNTFPRVLLTGLASVFSADPSHCENSIQKWPEDFFRAAICIIIFEKCDL